MVKNSSVLVKRHCPCEECGSSDAVCWYDDGHGFCFSCNFFYKEEKKCLTDQKKGGTLYLSNYLGTTRVDPIEEDYLREHLSTTQVNPIEEDYLREHLSTTQVESIRKEDIGNYLSKDITMESSKFYSAFRGISQDTMKKYQSFTLIEGDKPKSLWFPYGPDSFKVRMIDTKEFYSKGDMGSKSLFGLHIFTPGMSDKIVITEGELDAMSAYQMLDGKYPCVSVMSASSAKKNAAQAREFLNSFKEIILCLDSDIPGQKAAKAISELFDINKVRFVKFAEGMKDPNDYLKSNKIKEFVNAFNNADKYRPKGIVSSYTQVEEALSKNKNSSQIATYPFDSFNELTYGIRLGEFVLFTAPEKIGKTEFLRAIEYHLLKTTDHKIGIIHLEEEERRTICGLVNYHVNRPVHLPDSGFSNEDILKSYKELTKEEDRVHIYGHFGSDDPDIILDVIRHMVTVSGCKFVFLDHITMLVTGFEDDDERKKLDYLSTRLAMMTRELGFTLFLISHVNDDGKTRGSRNISKVADLIVSLQRDLENPDPIQRNTTNVLIKGNRFSGLSGPTKPLFFSLDSYTLSEKSTEEIQIETINSKGF